jgi:hypothetical protein
VTIPSLPADSRGSLFPIGRYLCGSPRSDSPAGFLGFELRGHQRLGHERRSLPVELAARALVDPLDGSAHPGRNGGLILTGPSSRRTKSLLGASRECFPRLGHLEKGFAVQRDRSICQYSALVGVLFERGHQPLCDQEDDATDPIRGSAKFRNVNAGKFEQALHRTHPYHRHNGKPNRGLQRATHPS